MAKLQSETTKTLDLYTYIIHIYIHVYGVWTHIYIYIHMYYLCIEVICIENIHHIHVYTYEDI